MDFGMSRSVYILIAAILVNIVSIVNAVHDDFKRILINDHDVLNERLQQLENIMSQLQTDNQQLKQDNQQTDNLVKQQSATILSQTNLIRKLESSFTTLQQEYKTNSGGSTYTIWGRTTCPSNNKTEMVYSGYAGGGIYTDSGSSQDLLCMTQHPTFGKTSGIDYGHIYGAEYDADFFAPHANGEDMPCAVCQRKSTTSTIMIPGRNTCYGWWNMEYSGYLSTGVHGSASGADYICIDIQPEFLVGGEVNSNAGRVFGPVIAKCGILKCPPYHNNYPVTCAVCSK